MGSNPTLSAIDLEFKINQGDTKRAVFTSKYRGHDPMSLSDYPMPSIEDDYPRVMVPSHVLTLAGIAVPVNHVEVTLLVSV